MRPFALAAMMLTSSAYAQRGLGLIEIDKPFPNIQLPSLDGGKLVAARDLFKGKRTVLAVFASW